VAPGAPARIGLIVNPLAGIGGPLGLKGSDDRALVDAAREGGAQASAPARALEALRVLARAGQAPALLAAAGAMGADAAAAAGLAHEVVGRPRASTTADDTRAAARAMADAGVDLLLFAGGDGTAVDVLAAVGDRVAVLGIPAGVKMHSAVFAITPRHAGELARAVAEGRPRPLADAEVADIDEEALRAGSIAPRLHGFLRVPVAPALVQGGKARSGAGEAAAQAAIAAHVVEHVLPRPRLCLVGPGTTTAAILRAVGLAKAPLGVDALRGRELVAADADEATLLRLVGDGPATVIVTPVGGQGFLLGRGNQQLSPRVLRAAGPGALVVVATEAKLAALRGAPLRLDTGDPALDAELAGFTRVVTGYGREAVYRVEG
jgi:predicted polyphosphate/ATP-dependent NAD kinase